MFPKRKSSVHPQAPDQGQDLARAADQALAIGPGPVEAQLTGAKGREAMMSSSSLP